MDMEAILHMELDAEKAARTSQRLPVVTPPRRTSHSKLPSPRPAAGRPPKESIATIRAMRAAPRTSTRFPTSSRIPSASHVPSTRSAIPPPPIHTLAPPRSVDPDADTDDAMTSVFDRASGRTSVPSVKSVAFPAPNFSPPAAPQPFATVPALPAAKRAQGPDESQGATPIQPIHLPPTSRRDIQIPAHFLNPTAGPSAFESIAPMSMSAAPPPMTARPNALQRSSTLALVLTLIFTLASVAVMGVGVFRPSVIERGKIALATAMKGKHKAAPPPAAEALPAPSASAAPIAVPPVLIDDVPSDLGDKDTALFLPESAKGHRIFVDGHPHDETDQPYVVVACGKHKVQIGSTGKEQALDLPCGSALRVE